MSNQRALRQLTGQPTISYRVVVPMDATTVLYENEPSAQPPPDQFFIFQQSGADTMIVVLHARERLHHS